ncbi:MAG TPA: HAD family hydrolase [Methylomirabilota bacterium]|jgi:HAD superfamily hydrolase (TIGR01509 family)|nr:HAD family hydrolase [Methylomirabilota bacterium]
MSEAHAPLPRPTAVIFDLDGTLVDTVEARIGAWLAVFREEGIRADRGQVAALIGADGRHLAREVAEAAGITLAPGRDERIDARCGELFAELNSRPRALPGVAAALGRIEAAGVPWAIATSSRREQVASSVEALGLARMPLIVDGSHVEHAKPAPDLLLLAAKELDADPATAWYVGDATWDMWAASAAGMVPIGVTSGAVDAATLRAAGARWVIASLAELEV